MSRAEGPSRALLISVFLSRPHHPIGAIRVPSAHHPIGAIRVPFAHHPIGAIRVPSTITRSA